eukprot:3028177-Pleurochrysis_carterae.AAC.1
MGKLAADRIFQVHETASIKPPCDVRGSPQPVSQDKCDRSSDSCPYLAACSSCSAWLLDGSSRHIWQVWLAGGIPLGLHWH